MPPPAFSLCIVMWGRRLRDANFQLERPFTTYPQIMDFVEEASAMEIDATVYAQQQMARAWLLRTFEASEPIVDCPADTSTTCPKTYMKGKPAGGTPCPCVWTDERIYAEFRAAIPPSDGVAALKSEKFFKVLREKFTPHGKVKNRHLNAYNKEAFFVKRKAAPAAV